MVSRKYLAGLALGMGISAVLYGLLFYHYYRTHPVPRDPEADGPRVDVPVPSVGDSEREEEKEIERIVRSVGTDPGNTVKRLKELSRKVRGGEEWVLLKMAAIANREKVYSPFVEKVVPRVRLSVEEAGGEKDAAVFTITLYNPADTYMHIPQVPASAELIFSSPTGVRRVVSLDTSLFGDAGEKKVLTLQAKGFWGVTVSCTLKDIGRGAWRVEACLRYTARSLGGYNLTAGEFRSNTVTVTI